VADDGRVGSGWINRDDLWVVIVGSHTMILQFLERSLFVGFSKESVDGY